MIVQLLTHTPEPERFIAAAAKLCYSKSGANELTEKLSTQQIESFLQMLSDLGHESPIEHVSFTFAIEGVSRTLTHQLVRHRMASYSQQSQRYVRLDQFEYIVPPAIVADAEASRLFTEAMEQDQRYYDEISNRLFEKHFADMVAAGVDEKKAKSAAEKKAIEDARYVFPNACETKIVVTMNARSLMNFFRHRCCERAQWEIRALAVDMLKLVKNVAPTLFRLGGPGCAAGPCPEGPMTCGKIVEVREKFKNL